MRCFCVFGIPAFLFFFGQAAFAADAVPFEEGTGTSPIQEPGKPQQENPCSKVHLENKMPPIRNQGNYGSCYAFAAADIMSFDPKADPRKTSKFDPDDVSAFATAIQYSRYDSRFDREVKTPDDLKDTKAMNGGNIAQAISAANEMGVCTEAKVPSMDFTRVDEFYENLCNSFTSLKSATNACSPSGTGSGANLEDLRNLGRAEAERRFTEAAWPFLQYQLKNAYSREIRRQLEKKIPPEQISDQMVDTLVAEAMKMSKEKDTERLKQKINNAKVNVTLPAMLQSLFVAECANDTRKRPGWLKNPEKMKNFSLYDNQAGLWSIEKKKQSGALDRIHSILTKGYPVGFGYFTSGVIQRPNPKKHGSHAGVIVGRTPYNGKCYFIVRNSWGKSWPGDHALDGLKARPVKDLPGHFALEESDLLQAAHSFVDY